MYEIEKLEDELKYQQKISKNSENLHFNYKQEYFEKDREISNLKK